MQKNSKNTNEGSCSSHSLPSGWRTSDEKVYSKRSRSSPESLVSHPNKKSNLANNWGNMSNINTEELLKAFERIIDSKIQTLPTKDDFNTFKEDIKSLKTQNESLKLEVKSLRENQLILQRRLDAIENKSRRNNLIIKGLHFKAQDDLSEIVGQFMSNVLQIKDSVEIVDVRPLGSKAMKGRHLLVSFSRNTEKWAVLKQSSRLKGTGWKIDQDYPPNTRRCRRSLFQLRWEIRRLNTNIKSVVRSDKLIINDVQFSWDDSVGLVYNQDLGSVKLKEMVGHDLSGFINGLLTKTAPLNNIRTSASPPSSAHQQVSTPNINNS